MTAEEKLKEFKKALKGLRLSARPYNGVNYPSFLSPQDIDLIVNLVVEKMKDV